MGLHISFSKTDESPTGYIRFANYRSKEGRVLTLSADAETLHLIDQDFDHDNGIIKNIHTAIRCLQPERGLRKEF